MKTVNDLTRDLIVSYFERFILPKVAFMPENPKPHKQSGYLTIRRKIDGRILLAVQIGECPPHKASEYFKFSLEKGERLFHHSNHVSSWQSRDDKNEKWGGAIIAGNYIVLFSGFPELLDEAVVLVLSLFFCWISHEKATGIAKISNNFFYPYLDRVV